MTSAWSTQFPQIFRTFPQQLLTSPPALPQFGPFFQDPVPRPRFYAPLQQPQFRHPFLDGILPVSYRPAPDAPRSPVLRDVRQLPPVADADEPHRHHHHRLHHLHHVIHYHYNVVPADVAPAGRNPRQQRPPCDPVTECRPVSAVTTTSPRPEYLPPPPPSPPTPTTVAPPPCNDDDSVVVDNVDYFPFGGTPIVVRSSEESAASVGTAGNPSRDHRGGGPGQSVGGGRASDDKSSFILANYLLPPDNYYK